MVQATAERQKKGGELMGTENQNAVDVNLQHETKQRGKWGFSDKTGWDWLQIVIQLLSALAIPIAIAVGTSWFSYQQNQTSLQIAQDQQQEATLQSYFDQIATLLLADNLQGSKASDVVREVARARTLTAVRRLDTTRKALLLQFLFESRLIGTADLHYGGNLEHVEAIILLDGADLSGVHLAGVHFFGVDLAGTNLSGADLSGADLKLSFLRVADLSKANLSKTDLSGANLSEVNLSHANLSGSYLSNVDFSYANLFQAHITKEQ
jgi:uncharacterized protein YjbI with pentapeptide repeats